MFCWEADQPTLEDEEAAADEKAWLEWEPRLKDGNNKNILEID